MRCLRGSDGESLTDNIRRGRLPVGAAHRRGLKKLHRTGAAWRKHRSTDRAEGRKSGSAKSHSRRDLALLYPALESGRVGMAAASATDGRLADAGFTVLADDRHYFPPYECAIVLRQEILDRFPALRPVLEQLSGRISDADMRCMNAA